MGWPGWLTGHTHRNLLRHFQAQCEKLGLPKLRFHDLRHTCASLLLAQGVDLPIVKETLGHAAIQTTMLYTHVAPIPQRKSADRMDDLLGSQLMRASPSDTQARAVIRTALATDRLAGFGHGGVVCWMCAIYGAHPAHNLRPCSRGVVRDGVEPSTSRFSVARSYQLSYLTGVGPGRVWGPGRGAELTGFEPAAFTLTG